MQKNAPSLRAKASLLEVVFIVLITNLREWLPIKSASINKLALQFERLAASHWTAKPRALSLEERDDGIGAQLHGQISIIVVSRKCGIPFAYREIEYAQFINSRADLTRWLDAFNLKAQNDLDDSSGLEKICLRDYVRWPFGDRKNVIVETPHMHRAAENAPDFYLQVCRDLRDKLAFDASKAKAVGQPIKVALHVRRGDVSDTQNSKRFTSIEVVKQSVIALVDALKASGSPFTIELYSQGTEEDFRELLSIHPMTAYLDSDPLETIERLTKADILLTAKSSFSQIAALMSEGIVLYEPYWHKPLSHWHVRQTDGSLDPKVGEDIDQLVAERQKHLLGCH